MKIDDQHSVGFGGDLFSDQAIWSKEMIVTGAENDKKVMIDHCASNIADIVRRPSPLDKPIFSYDTICCSHMKYNWQLF